MKLCDRIELILEHLPGWRLDFRSIHDLHCTVIGSNGMSIVCRTIQGNRISFYAAPPDVRHSFYRHWQDYGDFNSTIKCSASRKPESVAKDVKRRLIDFYIPRYEQQMKLIREESAAIERLEQVTDVSAKLLQGTIHHRDKESGYREVFWKNGKLRIYRANGSMRFELNTDNYDDGLRLAGVLNQYFL